MDNIIINICINSILAGIAFYKKSLTKFGAIVAWILSIVITYCGGTVGFVILLVTFLSVMVVGKISHKKRENIIKNINQKSGKRDSIQVLANVGVVTISLIIFYITKNDIFLITYACVMASSLADSIGSEIGVLSKQNQVDICSFKKTERGISGGVTILGLLFSLVGSFIIALSFYLLTDFNISILLFITALGFTGSIIDSILGSTIQVKYKCFKCNKITEKKEHCNNKTKYIKGISFINNDMVNFLNNISIFILSILFLSLH